MAKSISVTAEAHNPVASQPPAPQEPVGTAGGSIPASGYVYTNVDGAQVECPIPAPSAPAATTACCNNGSYSFSQHRQGTCSRHGGMAEWL